MVVNEGDEAKASASLARLRLFLSSHAPNGSSESTPSASPERPAAAVQENGGNDNGTSPSTAEHSEWGAGIESYPEFLADDDEDDGGQTTIPAAGAVASVTPMSQSSKEFARVKYLLQCSLPGYRVHEGVVIWDMRNPSLVAQYEQHTTGLLELESWVAVNDLGAEMGDVHSYGFTSLDANQTGMKFTTGNLQLSAPPPLEPSAEGNKATSTRQLVLCKIAVGRSLVIREEEEAKARLPVGYHSYYLHRDDEAGSSGQEQDPNGLQAALLDRGYYHEYILNNTLQVLPQYLVRFTFSAADAHGPVGPCALCEQHPAVVICRNCEAQICAHCDQEVHSANKLVRRHKRTPLRSKSRAIASGGARRGRRRSSTPSLAAAIVELGAENMMTPPPPPASSYPEITDVQINTIVAKQMEEGLLADETRTPTCRTHRGKKVEFYCPVCQVPVCVSCKMIGDHSIGEKGSHRLLTVADAYETCLRESLRSDPLIASRKTVIENKLQFLTRIQRNVQENKMQVAAAIKEQYALALRNLNEAVAVKMRVLSGESLEFERQLQQIDWVDESLEDHRTLLPPVEFLSAWSQHKLLRAEQRDFPPFAHGSNNSAEQVKADLQLTGELHVMSADQLATPHHRQTFTPGDDDDDVLINDIDPSSSNQGGISDSPQVELKAAALLAHHRRNPDSDMRKRLLSMKASLPTNMASRRVVSPKCQQILDEIRHDMLTQNAAKKNPSAVSPRGALLEAQQTVGLTMELHRLPEHNIHPGKYSRRLNTEDDGPEIVPLHIGLGTHYTWVYAGTPPQRASVIADTGSGIMAFPCSGCNGCGNHTDQPFKADNSSTLVHVTCSSDSFFQCKECKLTSDTCGISQSYMEGSSWKASVVEDVVYLGGDSSFTDDMMRNQYGTHFQFGCQSSETGLFVTQVADGIMGLSNTNNHIVAKLYRENKISNNLFSLCFAEKGGTMSVGDPNTLAHRGEITYAKIITDRSNGHFYSVQMKDIRIGGKSIKAEETAYTRGHYIVDSGTTDSYLPRAVKTEFLQVFKEVSGREYQAGSICTAFTKDEIKSLPTLQYVMEAYGEEGGEIILEVPPEQYLLSTNNGNSFCGGIHLSENSGGVIGANIMTDRDVIFDLGNQRVGFVDADCMYQASMDARMSPTATPASNGNSTSFLLMMLISVSRRRQNAGKEALWSRVKGSEEDEDDDDEEEFGLVRKEKKVSSKHQRLEMEEEDDDDDLHGQDSSSDEEDEVFDRKNLQHDESKADPRTLERL
ncbi:hypothetical protein BBJ29_006916 [Phytophthora kernoviae]|uniref:B box-type domain-containing protein n=1 Tax=Phytophthora kernoviae TaxID=325452 RepID=A0A3R7GRQ0_9STRA|nr:hypothetical protein BBJ29_006916 [Phytophthora kernoviae]